MTKKSGKKSLPKDKVRSLEHMKREPANRRNIWIQLTRRCPGNVVMELAVALPLLTMVLCGALDFGRFLNEAITAANAASAGAVYGSRSVLAAGNTQGMKAVAEQAAGNLQGLTASAQQFCQCADGSPMACDDACAEGSPQMYVQVDVNATFHPLFPYPGIPQSVDLSRLAVMRAR